MQERECFRRTGRGCEHRSRGEERRRREAAGCRWEGVRWRERGSRSGTRGRRSTHWSDCGVEERHRLEWSVRGGGGVRGGKGEGEDTDRAAGSGPFLGGLDCLAAVAICKTQSVKAEANEGRESREAGRCECGERNGDSVLSDNTGRNVECGTERRGQVGLQRCRRDCVRRDNERRREDHG